MMTTSCSELIQEYFSTGTLANLPTKLYINGQWQAAEGDAKLAIDDPSSAKTFIHVSAAQASDVELAISTANQAFKQVWKPTKGSVRASILNKAAALLEEKADLFSVVEALDSGKPLAEAQGDVSSAIATLRYYAGSADKLEGNSYPLGQGNFSFSTKEPCGVTAHIIPWNFPLSTTIRGVAPALAAGCTAVVKPAETTPLTALMMADIFQAAGLPDGVYNVIPGLGKEAGASLVNHKDVHHITFTGSVATGISVMQAAATNINSVTLELGGKSPILALADCDLEKTAEGVLWAIFYNAGQVCSAGSRLVVDKSIHKALVELIVEKSKQLIPAHALENPNYGAINSAQQLDKIDGFIKRAKQRGIHIACGGHKLETKSDGWFYAPTIMDDVPMDDELVQDEIFGPVLTVQVVDGLDEAIEAANCTNFALAAGVYSQNIDQALAAAQGIDSGQVTINNYWAGGIEVPFGGNKHSGIGREKGLVALDNYCTTKAITLAF